MMSPVATPVIYDGELLAATPATATHDDVLKTPPYTKVLLPDFQSHVIAEKVCTPIRVFDLELLSIPAILTSFEFASSDYYHTQFIRHSSLDSRICAGEARNRFSCSLRPVTRPPAAFDQTTRLVPRQARAVSR
jgi:hypothetical protein